MLVEREALVQQGLNKEVDEIDNMLYKGVLSREKVDKFWKSTADIILERLSRRALKKRAFVKQEDLMYYTQLDDPQIDIDHLTDETKMRIENLDELVSLR